MYALSTVQLAIPHTPIRNVSMHIPANTCYGIIGASNSGKSLLLSTLAGLHGRVSTQVHINGQSSIQAARYVGYVTPRMQLPTYLTVQQLLQEQGTLLGFDYDTTLSNYQRVLRWCALEQFATVTIRQLSHFDQRRVILANAMMARPHVLIIDEPTAGLTAYEQLVMVDILENLRNRNMTMVIATRGNAPLESLFDLIGILADGQIVSELDAQQIRTLPRTLMIYTSELPSAAYEHIVGIDATIVATQRTIVLTGMAVQNLSQILQVLLHYNVHIFRIEPRNNPLHDLVRQATMPQVLAQLYPPRSITSQIDEHTTSLTGA
jgi:ABC-2 type transport system ATP-binding protein